MYPHSHGYYCSNRSITAVAVTVLFSTDYRTCEMKLIIVTVVVFIVVNIIIIIILPSVVKIPSVYSKS